ncbi:acyl-CoA thioesterase [Desulfosarcina ovata]|uniref:Acyl-CoA thioesterase n=2 Tax=Desulfosarcina ovata TaxID=83564 RepID=A0A5K8ACP3_9BACT|nr:acyl-CoA thioesterase [Desulfosarcina ovata]BBO83025.1 acyl-CoA thioesterase [Desulfosarcina ovata subsp. sediminis]BBO90248.1 acyl-CoA thioesterase [Desulfosarcina ovata subsp. ovata]
MHETSSNNPDLGSKSVEYSRVIMAHMLLPQDANSAGIAHGGVVMKHIDNAGGVVAIRHTRGNCVTASIDRLDFHNPAFIGNLLTLKASLNMVGSTSMEVGVRVETEDLRTGEVRHTASAYLTFVALDENFRPRQVPPLLLETEEDKRRNRQAQDRRRVRLAEKTKEKSCASDPDAC